MRKKIIYKLVFNIFSFFFFFFYFFNVLMKSCHLLSFSSWKSNCTTPEMKGEKNKKDYSTYSLHIDEMFPIFSTSSNSSWTEFTERRAHLLISNHHNTGRVFIKAKEWKHNLFTWSISFLISMSVSSLLTSQLTSRDNLFDIATFGLYLFSFGLFPNACLLFTTS